MKRPRVESRDSSCSRRGVRETLSLTKAPAILADAMVPPNTQKRPGRNVSNAATPGGAVSISDG